MHNQSRVNRMYWPIGKMDRYDKASEKEFVRQQTQMFLTTHMKEQVKNRHIQRWVVCTCMRCGKRSGFVFKTNDAVVYMNRCKCMSHNEKVRISDWHEVTDHYMSQKDVDVLNKMNRFWKINSSEVISNIFLWEI